MPSLLISSQISVVSIHGHFPWFCTLKCACFILTLYYSICPKILVLKMDKISRRNFLIWAVWFRHKCKLSHRTLFGITVANSLVNYQLRACSEQRRTKHRNGKKTAKETERRSVRVDGKTYSRISVFYLAELCFAFVYTSTIFSGRIFYSCSLVAGSGFASGIRQNIGSWQIFSILWNQPKSAWQRKFSFKTLFIFPSFRTLANENFPEEQLSYEIPANQRSNPLQSPWEED